MMIKTFTYPDTSATDRSRAGRVTSRARFALSRTNPPLGLRKATLPIDLHRPTCSGMSLMPPAPSSWPPPGAPKGRIKIPGHGDALRLNEKSNPQES